MNDRTGPGARRRRGAALRCVALTVALATGACGGSGGSSASRHAAAPTTMPAGPSCIRPDSGKGCLPVAPAGKRVDLVKPSFSNPTSITNPLHPSSRIAQVIYNGQVDGRPFRTEFTHLPDPDLRAAADGKDLTAAARTAPALLQALATG
jgi:hypothetical protein